MANHASGYRDSVEPRIRLAFGSSDIGHIHHWRRRFLFTPGKQSTRDWNFETPLSPPQGIAPSLVTLPPPNSSYELYEYPGGFLTPAEGDAAAKLRIQAIEADHEFVEAASTVRTLAPGQRFIPMRSLTPIRPTSRMSSFVSCTRPRTRHMRRVASRRDTQIACRQSPLRAGNAASRGPAAAHEGTQIAIVAGPAGEEIHTDRHGQIKLKFPWDRRAKGDGSDTCWVRVSQG